MLVVNQMLYKFARHEVSEGRGQILFSFEEKLHSFAFGKTALARDVVAISFIYPRGRKSVRAGPSECRISPCVISWAMTEDNDRWL